MSGWVTNSTKVVTVSITGWRCEWLGHQQYKGCCCIHHRVEVCGAGGRVTYQAAEGVIEPVVQGQSLHHLKQRGVVKATRVSRDKLIHAVFLSSVCVCSSRRHRGGNGQRSWGEETSEVQADSITAQLQSYGIKDT